MFECEITKENCVSRWFRNGKAIDNGKKYHMTVEGAIHRLEISDVTADDEAEYKIIVRGMKSAAELIVEGMLLIIILNI